MSRGRVLFVAGNLPSPPSWGAGMRIYQLLRQVAATCDVTLLCHQMPWQSVAESDLGDLCEQITALTRERSGDVRRRFDQASGLLSRLPFQARELWSAPMQEHLTRSIADGGFDVVHVESSAMMPFDFGRATVVLDEHNIESELLERMQDGESSTARRAFNRLEAAKYRAFERRAWTGVAGVAVTSAREVVEVHRRAPATPTAVVPNGVDPDVFSPGPAAPTSGIVFNGLLSYRPNLDGIRFFLTEVAPLVRRSHPGVEITVVGSGTDAEIAQLRALGATVTGFVPDVRPYLRQAACVVVPIRMGGGTRLKVVEALSLAKPVVSTSLGCEGIRVRPDEHLLVADRPADLAAAVARVLDDAALRERLGRAGRQLAVEHYSWQRCAEPLLELYEQVRERARA